MNEKCKFEINGMRVSNVDEYLYDFNSIHCDETTDNFSPVKKHYRPKKCGSVSVGNITPQFTTTGAKGIFCGMGDDFK
eukprot:7764504-Ditylum_brightwellii.AAC.1